MPLRFLPTSTRPQRHSRPQQPWHSLESLSMTRPRALPAAAPPHSPASDGFLSEYRDDILTYLQSRQSAYLPNVAAMRHQPQLTWSMRSLLVSFLIEVHLGFALSPATLLLAVSLMDRYTAKRTVYRRHYQLLGCACLWIACKFYEHKQRVPLLQELKELCRDVYSETMFVQMERHILVTLNWDIAQPTADIFLPVLHPMVFFLLEVSLFSEQFLTFPASSIAAAAVVVAERFIGTELRSQAEWNPNFLWPIDWRVGRESDAGDGNNDSDCSAETPPASDRPENGNDYSCCCKLVDQEAKPCPSADADESPPLVGSTPPSSHKRPATPTRLTTPNELLPTRKSESHMVLQTYLDTLRTERLDECVNALMLLLRAPLPSPVFYNKFPLQVAVVQSRLSSPISSPRKRARKDDDES